MSDVINLYIVHGNPDKIITTDASTQGWGSVFMSFQIGGRWNETENKQPINYLELLAAFYALRDVEGMHVGLKMDNTCAIALYK
jgi:putative heme iron utilization protein